MKTEKFLDVVKQLGHIYPNAEVYATDTDSAEGTFETMYLETRIDTEKKIIWVIFDAEDGSPIKLKGLISDLEQAVANYPGCDIVFEDCFRGKNTFETYFSTFNIDEDDNTIEIQLDADRTYNALDNINADALRMKYHAIKRAGNILCAYCERNDCESCVVRLLVDCAAREFGIDLTGVHQEEDDDSERYRLDLIDPDDEKKSMLYLFYDSYESAEQAAKAIAEHPGDQTVKDFRITDTKTGKIWESNIEQYREHHGDTAEPKNEDCNTYRESEYNDNGIDTRTGKPFGTYFDPDEPEIEVCEYETVERFFVYDKNDDCVSDGFRFEDGAIAFANKTGNPVVKVHTYFIDSDRGGKLYPDGEPTIVWKDGRPV